MNGLAFLAITLSLFAMPGVAHRTGLRLSPRDWARVIGASFTTGFVLLETALLLCAMPLLSHVSDVQMRGHFFPGGTAAGVASLVLAIALPAAASISATRTFRRRRRLRAEPYMGIHTPLEGADLVVLPTGRLLAQAVAGDPPQVQISQGLIDAFDEGQIDIIIRHELSHLKHRHDRYLLLSTGVRIWLGWIPAIRSTIDILGLALEEWADDDAAGLRAQRARIRTTLVTLATADLGAAVSHMAPDRTVLERLASLDADPVVSTRGRQAILFGMAALLQVAAVVPLLRWL